MTFSRLALKALFISLFAGSSVSVQAADLSVIASVAFKDAYLEMLPAFESATGMKVLTQWVPTVEIMRKMKSGEPADLVLMSEGGIKELAKLGKILPLDAVPFVKSGIGIAVKTGAPAPDVSSSSALKQTLLAASSIAYSTGPSGVYLGGLFERMGISDALKAKTRLVQGEPVGELIARGEVEIGFQQIPEIVPVKGLHYLGPLPADIQQTTVFYAGVHASTQQVDAARALIKFLTAPAAANIYQKYGMQPG
jgi:molybdate transport system substrate-binding protein